MSFVQVRMKPEPFFYTKSIQYIYGNIHIFNEKAHVHRVPHVSSLEWHMPTSAFIFKAPVTSWPCSDKTSILF